MLMMILLDNLLRCQESDLHHAQMMRQSSSGLLMVQILLLSEVIMVLSSPSQLLSLEKLFQVVMIVQSKFGIKMDHASKPFQFQEQSGPSLKMQLVTSL